MLWRLELLLILVGSKIVHFKIQPGLKTENSDDTNKDYLSILLVLWPWRGRQQTLSKRWYQL